MRMLWLKVKTILALGIGNLFRVFWYRFSVKYNINPVRRIQACLIDGEFFVSVDLPPINAEPNTQWIGQQTYFGWHVLADKGVPNWHRNCMTGAEIKNPLCSWWRIPDFDPQLGDVKTVWEASRFDWCLAFAQQIRNGNEAYLGELNMWIADWTKHNPPYLGVNWKCGQEASIRVMHLAMSAIILNQTTNTSAALIALIKTHLQRIAPTISYAIAQDNNHGTSEAAALFIGGHWLIYNDDPDGKKWQELGRKWLENRAKRLIKRDGSFSQYSTNYHRVMLDTYSIVEVWRLKHQLPAFSDQLYRHLQVATDWLHLMVQDNGDVPNLGANDGARLLPLSDTSYRDFRPTVQLANILFYRQLAFERIGTYDLPAKWLGVERPNEIRTLMKNQTLLEGGYQVIRHGNKFALLNAPQFTFRPSQADVLHADIWINGRNIMMDSGTYSYAASEAVLYYSSVMAHNSVQFDENPQMPRLSRFLLGDWIKTRLLSIQQEKGSVIAGAAYIKDKRKHRRVISVTDTQVKIVDSIDGVKNKAFLRWHLSADYYWKLDVEQQTAICKDFVLEIKSDSKVDLQIDEVEHSLYYHCKATHQVLVITVVHSAEISSVLHCLN